MVGCGVAKGAADVGARSGYRPTGGFVLRTPLVPFATLAAWSDGATTDVDELRRRLRALVTDPAIREALVIASPALVAALPHWQASPDDAAAQATERALVRYVSRLATRCTPFGLFAGVTAGQLADGPTTLTLRARAAYRRNTRLDNDYLFAACAELAATPAIQAELTYRPNSGLYQTAGRWRYAEARMQGEARSHHLVAIEPSPYLDAVLARAADGAALPALIEVLCADPEVSAEEAQAYLRELIATQVLEPDLQAPVTGPEPLGHVVTTLRATAAGQAAAQVLAQVGEALDALDADPLGVDDEAYRAIAATLRAGLPTKVDPARLVQVDLAKPAATAVLAPDVVARISAAVDALRRIAGHRADETWANFRAAFGRRYETRTVPLVEVLDDEIGIGFGGDVGGGTAPLLATLDFPAPPGPPGPTGAWGRLQDLLAARVGAVLARGATELVLSEADLAALAAPTPARVPPTFTATCTLLAASPDALAAGDYDVFLRYADGGPGTRLLGRFCHTDPAIAALVAANIEAEHALRPDAVFAEIAHLPEGRIGNILMRPVLRAVEIVYLGLSGAPRSAQLPVTDLLVSVVGERVVLRSQRLGCEVVPRLTSAHNFSARSLGIYRFLCAMAGQEGSPAGWTWGALERLPFLPRVRWGRVIFARAQWRLTDAELRALGKVAGDGADARRATMAAMSALRADRRLPRWVVLADGDNELCVDLDNELCVDSFVHLVKARSHATLLELLPAPDQLCVAGPEGTFAHELMLPFARGAASPATIAAPASATSSAVPRRFPPGSRWLYAKLFCGEATADTILREAIAPTVEEVRAEGLADGWFFIRYNDGGHHLRVRFTGEPARLLGDVWPRVAARLEPLLATGACWQVQLDTYERELERYGGPAGIGLCEQIFTADSDAVLGIIRLISGDEGAIASWQLALRGMDRLLGDFGFDLPGKLALATRCRDGFAAEFGVTTAFQRQLGAKYRTEHAAIASILDAADDDDDHPFSPGIALLAARSATIAPLAAELRAHADAGRLATSIPDLVASLIHMFVNRLQLTGQRRQELVLYDLLRRHYEGVIARSRRG